MPITKLPDATAHLLGSPQIISTPVSVVKELLDNAIDAEATIIEVLLSPNTIDRVEVRDNGVGIHPDDYNSLGKHGHTSKLGTFEDLRTLAGSTLGFRGEALASANALGKLTITTKTFSDSVATVLHINSKVGGVHAKKHGSAPVGTTVSVTDLYDGLPVRKRMMEKNAPKILGEVQGLLQSYAMARPQLKLSMKVLKSKRQNWDYCPRPHAGVEEAVIQLFGIDAKYRCMEQVRSFGITGIENRDLQPAGGSFESGFIFEAYLVAPSALRLDRVPKQCYFSVDSRPVTGSRGIAKKLKSTYRKYVGRMLGITSEVQVPENIFIRLNIKCPKGSYDVNIEPLKDSVLFEDEGAIVAYFEEFCKSIYGPLSEEGKKTLTTPGPGERNLSLGEVYCAENSGSLTAPTASHIGHGQNWKRTGTMNSETDEDVQNTVSPRVAAQQASGVTPRTEISQRKQPVSAASLAPTAKVDTLQNHTNSGSIGEVCTAGHDRAKVQPPAIMSDMLVGLHGSAGGNPWIKKPTQPSQPGASLVGTPQDIAASSRQPMKSCSGSQMNVHPGLGRIHTTPIQYSLQDDENCSSSMPEPPILHHPGAPPRDLDLPPSSRKPLYGYNNVLTGTVPAGLYQSPVSSPIRPNPTRAKKPLSGGAQLPWTPPSSTRKHRGEWDSRYSTRPKRAVDGLKQTTLSFHGRKHDVPSDSPKRRETPRTSHQISNKSRNPQLSQGFETTFSTARQQLIAANNNRSGFKTALADSVAMPKGEHAPEPLQDKEPFIYIRSFNTQPGERTEPDARPIETSLTSEDSRAYLLRRQKSVEADKNQGNRPTKLRRLKSCLMPLETIPRDKETHGIVLDARVDLKQLDKSLWSIQKYDLYVVDGVIEEALNFGHNEVSRVEERLDALLSCWLEQQTGEKEKIESHLCELIKGSEIKVHV